MVRWQTLNLSDLLPTEIEPLVTQAGSIAQNVSSILSNMASVVGNLTPFIIDNIDPVEMIVRNFVTEIQNFLTDLKDTGVYMLVVPGPKTEKHNQGTDTFLEVIENSFYDVGDSNRPQFSSAANVGGVVILVGSASFSGIALELNKLGKAFGIKDFTDVFKSSTKKPQLLTYLLSNVSPLSKNQNIHVETTDGFINKGAVLVDDEIIEYQNKSITNFMDCLIKKKHLAGAEVSPAYKSFISEPPDWDRTKVIDLFPSLGVLLRSLESFVNNVLPAQKASEVVTTFSQLLQDKANNLSSIANRLNSSLNNLVNDFPRTGFNLLKIPHVPGGNKAFIEALKTAENKPQYSQDAYTSGIVILAGTAEYQVLETFF